MTFSASTDLQTTLVLCYMCWLEDEPSPTTLHPLRRPPLQSFSCLSLLKKEHLFYVPEPGVPHGRKEEAKGRHSFLCYVCLMTLLRLNNILLLRTPVRHSSWRDADFAALLVPPWKLHKNTDVQIQSWVSEHPCSQSFCGAWHCCWERGGNNSQTGSRNFIPVTAICASHYTQHKPTKKHHPRSTDGPQLQLAV